MPDDLAMEHSGLAAENIRAAIAANNGSISFAEFMHHALYASGLGYYSAGAAKFGAHGDFVTAPEISPLFGHVIARQSALVLEQTGGGDIFEPGAGSGALAVSILSKLDELHALPERYLILEVSADLRERQAALLQREIPEYLHKISWVTEVPSRFTGVVVANEVLDAMPVERFLIQDNAVLQARVAVTDNTFTWSYRPASALLHDAVRALEVSLECTFANGYASEISFGARHWVAELAGSISKGFAFLIDYGVTQREYYARDRDAGWLRCHFRHHAHNNPLLYPGIQDITAWVDFSSIAAAASGSGAHIAGYLTQSDFLLLGGLEQEMQNFAAMSARRQLQLSSQVKKLTLPAEMGESFKCLGLACGNIVPPAQFGAADRSHTL